MSGYVRRAADLVLSRRIAHHAAVLVVGPRASGKTTTVARFAKTTIRLDHPAQAAVVRADPDAAIAGKPEPILLDEWQLVPEVLAAVKRTVDADPRPGRFLITGSVRGEIDASSWAGTGRLIRVPMYGLTTAELRRRIATEPLLDRLATGDLAPLLHSPTDTLNLRDYAGLVLRSGFPEPALRLPSDERAVWMESYVEQLLVHDASERVGRRDSTRLRRFLEAYALNTGGLVDSQTLYQVAGISKATGESYEALLRNLFLVEAVPAWWTNRLKRLARSPKRYVIDPALAMAVLRVNVDGLMSDGDLLGRALDTFVVAQLRAQLSACVSQPRLHHLRHDNGRHEVDLIVEYGGGRVFGLEIKATAAPDRDDARHLRWLRDQLGDRFLGGAVLHTGPEPFMLDDKIVASPIAALWPAP